MSHPWTDVCSILFAFMSVLLIFIVLLQRGRGGGLAGAFGATGGQSAFGTKAGDVFTRITIGIAVVWVCLAAVTGYAMTRESRGHLDVNPDVGEVAPANPGNAAGQPAGQPTDGKEGTTKSTTTKSPAIPGPTKTAPPATSSSSAAPPAKGAPATETKTQPSSTK